MFSARARAKLAPQETVTATLVDSPAGAEKAGCDSARANSFGDLSKTEWDSMGIDPLAIIDLDDNDAEESAALAALEVEPDRKKMTATKQMPVKASPSATPSEFPAPKAPGIPAPAQGDAASQLAELQKKLGADKMLELLTGCGKPVSCPGLSPPVQKEIFTPSASTPKACPLASPGMVQTPPVVPKAAPASARSTSDISPPPDPPAHLEGHNDAGASPELGDAFDLSQKD